MKAERTILCLLLGFSSVTYAQNTQTVDLSTGVVNGSSGVLIAIGQPDDTWTVTGPGYTTPVSPKCFANANSSAWATSSCGRWIDPYGGSTAGACSGGTFTFKTTFNTTYGCGISSANISLNAAGADNKLTSFVVNGSTYNLSPQPTFNPLTTGLSIPINPADIHTGANTIEAVVVNYASGNPPTPTPMGLLLCGKLTINYASPVANAGPDVTICKGSCATIGVGGGITANTTYTWTGFVDQPFNAGTGQTISVCPSTTTHYTLTVADSLTGCSSKDQVTVNVEDNTPRFKLTSTLDASNNFYTLNATPVNTAVSGIAGFGYSWTVEEIVSPTTTTVVPGSQVVNSNCWWNSSMTSSFNGYDGVFFSNTGSNPMHWGCSNPPLGKLAVGHTYRITRGTWSTVCPWQQYSAIVYMTH